MSEEILPNMNDIGNRHITTAELERYRGIKKQVVCISDDKNRLAILYGDRVNHYEKTVLFSDLTENTLEACFKLLKYTYLRENITESSFTLNTDLYSIFDLTLNRATQLSLVSSDTLENQAKEVTLIVSTIADKTSLSFTNSIRWIGNLPEFPTDSGSKYLIKLYYTSTGWIGEYRTSTDLSEDSEDSSLINISEEDRQIMSDISQNLDDIRQLAANLTKLTTLENSIEDLNVVSQNTTQLVKLAESISKLTDLSISLDSVLQVQQYLDMIKLVAHHLKDKYFLDVKVTDKKIDGNTILPLDKIVLAPCGYIPTSGGGSSSGIDTDSSDGTISPQLLVWSDENPDDAMVMDGTIVVSPTHDKINSVIVKE